MRDHAITASSFFGTLSRIKFSLNKVTKCARSRPQILNNQTKKESVATLLVAYERITFVLLNFHITDLILHSTAEAKIEKFANIWTKKPKVFSGYQKKQKLINLLRYA